MSWLQLRITTHSERAAKVEKVLNAMKALSITLEDNADEPIYEPALNETPLWTDTRVTGLFPADIDTQTLSLYAIERLGITEQQLHWHVLEDKDWEREWMTHYHPIQCAEHFWICPSWTAPPDPDAVNLMLDPGLAFGTGTHPTTFLCLQWLAKQTISGLDAIDYGCGSGILGIAALLLQAKRAVGVDIDPQALKATSLNVERNNLNKTDFPVYLPKDAPTKPVDIILANILAGPLVELAPSLIAQLKPEGKICLSGVLATQKESIVNAYSADIHIEDIQEKDGWICVAGTRKTTNTA